MINFVLVKTIVIKFNVCGHPDRRRETHTRRCRSSVRRIVGRRRRTRRGRTTTTVRTTRPSDASLFFRTTRNARRFAMLRGRLIRLAFSGGNKQMDGTLLGRCGSRGGRPLILFSNRSTSVGFNFRKGGRGVLDRRVCFRTAGIASSAIAVQLGTTGNKRLSFGCQLLPGSCVMSLAIRTDNVRGFFSPSAGGVGVR